MHHSIGIFICLLLMLGYSNKSAAQSDEGELFIQEFEEKNMDEITKSLDEIIGMFEYYELFGSMMDSEVSDVPLGEERYEEDHQVNYSLVDAALEQFTDIELYQLIEDSTSSFQLKKSLESYWSPMELPESNYESYTVKKISYRNGEVKTDGLNEFPISFSMFPESWGFQPIIDKLEIEYTVDYLLAFDSVMLSASNPEATYNGGKIKIEKIDRNYLYVTLTDDLTNMNYKIVAVTKEGKTVGDNQYSTSSKHPKESEKAQSELLNFFRKAKKKIAANDFKNEQEFVKYLKKTTPGLDYFKDSDGLTHKEIYFNGNIAQIKVYFDKEFGSNQVYLK